MDCTATYPESTEIIGHVSVSATYTLAILGHRQMASQAPAIHETGGARYSYLKIDEGDDFTLLLNLTHTLLYSVATAPSSHFDCGQCRRRARSCDFKLRHRHR